MLAQLPQLRAPSIRQPWAEVVLRGEKTVEYRSKPTNIRGEVYIYASVASPEPGQELHEPLPRGQSSGSDGEYEWELENPKRLAEPVAPTQQPQPVWFYPFGNPASPGQMVLHVQSYLPDDVLNVLQAHQQALVKIIHTQMQNHFEESVTEYDVQVSRGFTTLRPNNYTQTENQKSRDFRVTVDDKMMIRGLLFHGFKKSLYELLRFQSNTERVMAVVLENDNAVRKWLKPAKGDFRIYYANDDEYIPDFAVETDTARYIIELKSSGQTAEEIVQAKARAASLWCQRATEHSAGGKPWKYLLVPHDQLDESMTLDGLAKKWEWKR